jgi:hypothetical protein
MKKRTKDMGQNMSFTGGRKNHEERKQKAKDMQMYSQSRQQMESYASLKTRTKLQILISFLENV